MGSIWQKLWFYTRITFLSLIGIFVIVFILLNLQAVIEPKVSLVFTSYDRPGLLVVLFLTSFLSILGWWLTWTIVRTVRQIREGRDRAKVERLQREVEDMKVKAARLQTKSAAVTPSNEIDAPPPAI